METRANFLLIGAFTLFGILGSLGFFLWLAKVEIDRQYAYYDILFDDVSGLGEAGDVRYNGLPVGQVVGLSLDEDDSGKIRVRIEIDGGTPVKTDTEATLQLLGVTGVSYVALSGGSPGADPLTAAPGEDVPVITAGRSAIQSLFEQTPELLSKAIVLLDDLHAVVSPENQAAVGNILANLENASGGLDKALADFSSLSDDLSRASAVIGEFTDRLAPVADSAETTLNTANETLKSVRVAVEEARATIGEATGALASARQAFDSANGLMAEDLPRLIGRVESTAGTVETVVADIGGRAGDAADRIGRLSDAATARLNEAEATIARLDTALDTATATMNSIGETSRNVNALVTGDGAALVADARRVVASANEAMAAVNIVIREDLPVITADIRAATATVNTVVAKVGADFSSLSGRLEGIAGNTDAAVLSATETLRSATETFRNANDTLAAISATMATADTTLSAARDTFTGVNRLIEEDAEAIVADIRGGAANLNRALDEVADSLPAITGDVSRTLGRATNLLDSLNGIVAGNSEEIDVFLQAGLPQFVSFIREGRKLIANLERLTAKIESDPARFLLGTQVPEFGR